MPDTQPAETVRVRFRINGKQTTRTVESRKLLSDFIREDLVLTGTHVGCEHGVCGACTVVVNGELVRSCLMFAAQVDGAEIETIEGLGSDPDDMHPVQQAFWRCHGLQCGFCTPGMVLTAKELLARNPAPSDAEIRTALAGNLCRCTGYVFIVASVKAAAEDMRNQSTGDAAP